MEHLKVIEHGMEPIQAVHTDGLILKVETTALLEDGETTYNIHAEDNYENNQTF